MEVALERRAQHGPTLMTAPVRRVVVFEDRAQVTRMGLVTLDAGSHRVIVEGVTPLAVERSLQVKAVAGAIQVGDSRVARFMTSSQGPASVVQLRERLEQLKERGAELGHQSVRLQQRLELLGRWLNDLKLRLAAGTARGQDPQAFAGRIGEVMAEQERLSLERQQLSLEQEEVARESQAIEAQISTVQMPTGRFVARLEARVEVEAPGTFELSWSYVVPCALWRPEHLARLTGSGEGARLEFETQGVIWQATGEAWEEIELACSTARPGRSASAPLLSDDLLVARRKSEQERREVHVEIRDEEIQTTGLGGAQQATGMPGVDDGGEALTWAVEGRVTVPANGRPVRVPLARWQGSARVMRVCLPEKLAQVILKSEQANAGTRPILAGPVVLYQESGYMGRTSIGFVAPGERFALSFGSQDGVRVHRERKVQKEETRLTGYQVCTITVSLAFSNLSDQLTRIEVTERIPVSELEEVRISLTDHAPGKPDGDGRVVWVEALPPRGHLTRELVYRVEAPARVHLPIF